MRLRILIVDDEPVARERLRRLLQKTAQVADLVECENGLEAVDLIEAGGLDLVFLDVQMPGMTGLDVVRKVGVDRMPAVVFVTAFDRFALQAFDSAALDYLLKPFGEARLRKCLARVLTFLNGVAETTQSEQLRRLLSENAGASPDCLLVRDHDRVVFIRPAEIDWVEADADYARLRVGAETHLVRSTMIQLEERLAPEGFVRIHRSRLVNLHRIKELRRLSPGESVVVLKTGERLGASQGCLKQLQERLGVMS